MSAISFRNKSLKASVSVGFWNEEGLIFNVLRQKIPDENFSIVDFLLYWTKAHFSLPPLNDTSMFFGLNKIDPLLLRSFNSLHGNYRG